MMAVTIDVLDDARLKSLTVGVPGFQNGGILVIQVATLQQKVGLPSWTWTPVCWYTNRITETVQQIVI